MKGKSVDIFGNRQQQENQKVHESLRESDIHQQLAVSLKSVSKFNKNSRKSNKWDIIYLWQYIDWNKSKILIELMSIYVIGYQWSLDNMCSDNKHLKSKKSSTRWP